MIGKLRKRLIIQQVSEASDSGGGYTTTWSDLDTVWGELIPLSGRERMRAMQLESPVTHKVTIRYRSDITTKHRLKLDGTTRLFNIISLMNVDERDKDLEMMVEEGVAT